MFTGIVEKTGKLIALDQEGDNLNLKVQSDISGELKVDQSLSHNGCCLTVVETDAESYTVTAIQETLSKTNIGKLKVGDQINLERSLRVGDRLDGHFVQGHVDQVGTCSEIKEANGSWYFTFEHEAHQKFRNVDKGSICVNGVSLTVVDPSATAFSVAIIPYTYEHTNFGKLAVGDQVNLEFDILGKYILAQQK